MNEPPGPAGDGLDSREGERGHPECAGVDSCDRGRGQRVTVRGRDRIVVGHSDDRQVARVDRDVACRPGAPSEMSRVPRACEGDGIGTQVDA